MFNPYSPYEAKYLAAFKQKGVKFFVRQTYDRGKNLLEENPKPAFLLTHYEQLEMAQNHFDALGDDPGKRLYRMDTMQDVQELQRFGLPNSAERIYVAFKTPDAELRARKMLDKKLRAFIDHKLQWRVPGHTTVDFSLKFIFGKIYVVLKHGGRYDERQIEEIENMSYVL